MFLIIDTDISNASLSENRAKSLMNALIATRIEKYSLSSRGWGSQPSQLVIIKPKKVDSKTEELK